MSNPPAILRLERVSKAFDQPILHDVSVEIRQGQTTVIIGPSGCGKSVTLKLMIGLLKPDAGTVHFRDAKISALAERDIIPLRRKMGFLFQGAALFDSMTVEENVCFPLVEHNIGSDSDKRDRCGEVLGMVGLDGLQHRYPAELSGGQKKRVALARAIAMDPEVVFYDEPTTGLDPIRSDLINELILKLQRGLGNTGLVVTHDMTSARKVGDRILMLHEGQFILDTTPDRLEDVEDDIVRRFVDGQASPEELATLAAVHPDAQGDS